MGRRRQVMSEQLKLEIARELGILQTVEQQGWGAITAKDAGNIVKRAIQMAEEAAARNAKQ